jgi:hypothetical protein
MEEDEKDKEKHLLSSFDIKVHLRLTIFRIDWQGYLLIS